MSNHTDMKDKYCGHSNDISQYTKVAAVGRHYKRGAAASGRGTSFVVSFVWALNRVNVVAVTRIHVSYVGVIGRHVPCHYDFMFPRRSYHARLRARAVRGALPPGRGVWGGLRPPQGSREVWGGTPPNDTTVSNLLLRNRVWQTNLKTDLLLRNLLLVESTFKNGVVANLRAKRIGTMSVFDYSMAIQRILQEKAQY